MVTPPSYNPQMTPQQMRQFQLFQQMNRQMPQRELTYQEWLAQRGGGNPYASAPPQQMPDFLSSFGGGSTGGAVTSGAGGAATGGVLSGGGAAGAGLAESGSVLGSMGLEGASTSGLATAAQGPTIANAAALPGAEAGMGAVAAPAAAAVIAAAAANNAWEVGGNKIIKGGAKSNHYVDTALAVNPITAGPMFIAKKLGISPGKMMFGDGKTTRQIQGDNTRDLQKAFPDDATYQAFVNGMREQNKSGPPDPSKPFGDTKGNKYGSWDEYKKAGLDAANLTGVLGNLKLGSRYTKLTPEQQIAFTQKAIDADLYHSKKGEVDFTDSAKAGQMFDEFEKSGMQAGPMPSRNSAKAPPGAPGLINQITGGKDGVISNPIRITGPTQGPGHWEDSSGNPVGGIDPGFTMGNRYVPDAKKPIMIPRSKTSSPGIGLNGQRINYGRK